MHSLWVSSLWLLDPVLRCTIKAAYWRLFGSWLSLKKIKTNNKHLVYDMCASCMVTKEGQSQYNSLIHLIGKKSYRYENYANSQTKGLTRYTKRIVVQIKKGNVHKINKWSANREARQNTSDANQENTSKETKQNKTCNIKSVITIKLLQTCRGRLWRHTGGVRKDNSKQQKVLSKNVLKMFVC